MQIAEAIAALADLVREQGERADEQHRTLKQQIAALTSATAAIDHHFQQATAVATDVRSHACVPPMQRRQPHSHSGLGPTQEASSSPVHARGCMNSGRGVGSFSGKGPNKGPVMESICNQVSSIQLHCNSDCRRHSIF